MLLAMIWEHGEPERSYYHAAAICKRGHVETPWLSEDREVPGRCGECGAPILTACPACGHRIRGKLEVPGVVDLTGQYDRPRFCDNAECGAPFPWVDRQGRIYELENLLDEENLDPADELTVREQLDALAELDPDDDEARRRWQRVREKAPGLWEKSGARSILESVVSASIKGGLGL